MTVAARKHSPYRETRRLPASERREIILKAAQAILLKEGFAGLALRNVANRAGIRLATLQYYFKTREELFQAAFEDAANAAWQNIMDLVDKSSNTTPEDRLQIVFRGLSRTTKDDALAGFFFELWARSRYDDFAAKLMDTFYSEAVALVAGLISLCMPQLSSRESKRRATMAFSMVEGLTIFGSMEIRANRRSKISEKDCVAILMDLAIAEV